MEDDSFRKSNPCPEFSFDLNLDFGDTITSIDDAPSQNQTISISASKTNPNTENKGETVNLTGSLATNQETKRDKVKLAGRRRLCKRYTNDSVPQQDEKEESIADIMDDFAHRLGSLSLTKEKHSKKESKPEEELYFSSKEDVEEDEIDTEWRFGKNDDLEDDDNEDECESFKVVPRKAKYAYISDEEEDEIEEKGKGKEKEKEIDSFKVEDEKVADLKKDFSLIGKKEGRDRVYKLMDRVYAKLYPHQQVGINWLWGLYCKGTGGILGDDMGLGKTMQISAFLAGLFQSELIKRVLIVAPKTLVAHWVKELSVVGLSHKVRDFSGANLNMRNNELKYTLKEGGILITTYDIVRNNYKAIRGGDDYDRYNNYEDENENSTIWDYVILDEGHIIKNPKTQRAQSLYEIPCLNRIIISGTPIQNNLKELWALFNFCCPEVLGDKTEFKDRYEKKILRGNEKNASDREKYVGSTVAKELRERIRPYFLRRLKSEVFGKDGGKDSVSLPNKNELIIWLKLSSCQRQLYEGFLNSELVHSCVGGSPLAAITIMKKICDHPLLLTKRGAEEILEGMDGLQISDNEKGLAEKMASSLANRDSMNEILQMDYTVSCKITFILSLLEGLVKEGHITLIFSQSTKMLDLIQEAIRSVGYDFLRIDGSTKITERQKIVKDFQEGVGASIFLLTTQVGGLGLTLTKADRVIVVDPAWNPSMDNQSVDRAYRIGQTRDVIVYRLMTCGTIEEKIYKMQVFKGGLFKTATEQKEQTRYFSKKDIQELFRLPEHGFDVSVTHKQLQEEHAQQITLDEYLSKHIEYLEQQDIGGVSHHSLLFSKTAIVPVVLDTQESQENIGNRIIRASSSAARNYYSENPVNGANNAFKPKDVVFNARKYNDAPIEIEESPENIMDKIKRLSNTLARKDLVMKLPDKGEKIRRQLIELEMKLNSSASPIDLTSGNKKPEIISLDEVTSGLENLKTL